MPRDSRTGFSGRARQIDHQRGRRGGVRFPLGPGLKYDTAGRITLDVSGALAFEGNTLRVQVASPLAQSSPIRLELGEGLEVRGGKVVSSIRAGDGVEIQDGRVSRKPDEDDAITSLGQTVSATPTQEEVQAISDKVDLILAHLRRTRQIKE